MSNSTPTPWNGGKEAYASIYAPDGFCLAVCYDGINHDKPNRANAALIVRAVNEHAALSAIAKSHSELLACANGLIYGHQVANNEKEFAHEIDKWIGVARNIKLVADEASANLAAIRREGGK